MNEELSIIIELCREAQFYRDGVKTWEFSAIKLAIIAAYNLGKLNNINKVENNEE